jgi:hypothetical protein
MPHGTFFRKGVIHLDDGRPLQLKDLVVGGDIKMLGQEFFITDADEFTRKYFQYVYTTICALLWFLRCTMWSLCGSVHGLLECDFMAKAGCKTLLESFLANKRCWFAAFKCAQCHLHLFISVDVPTR